MTIHILHAISPILSDRVILVRSDDDELNETIGDELLFAKSVNGLCWMLDESQEPFLVKVVEGEAGDDDWCETCEEFEETGAVCDVWDELIALGFEPMTEEAEAAMADDNSSGNTGGFKIPDGVKRFFKKEGEALAGVAKDYAKDRAKKYAKEQASAVGISLEDAFFDDLFEGLFGNGVGPISNGVKGMTPKAAAGILAIEWPCSKDQVIAGYRAAARIAHPDKGGTAEKFMRVAEARAVLMRALGETK